MTALSPGAPVAADAVLPNRLAGRDRELRVLQGAAALGVADLARAVRSA